MSWFHVRVEGVILALIMLMASSRSVLTPEAPAEEPNLAAAVRLIIALTS